MNPLYLYVAAVACYANDNDAFIPEMWAQEGLAILEENMLMARLVHRDFEPVIANFGDVVNTRRPGQAKIRRKKDGTTLSHQDAVATNVRVPLDQWFYSSFTIKDGEASKSFQELVTVYLLPHAQNIARAVDRALLGRIHQYLSTPTKRVGRLSNLDATNSKDYVLEARKLLNDNKAYPEGRNLVLSSASETALLKNELFIQADRRGDGGSALESANLGRILGFNTYLAQNVNSVSSGAETAAGTVTNALAAGSGGSQAVTLTGYQVSVGEYATVAGNDQPTFITAATVGGGNTTAITLNEVNKFATLATAVLTVFKACDVVGAYAVDYSEAITLDGYLTAAPPQVGQLLAFGTGASRKVYTVIESEDAGATCTVYLDRPLEVALADNDLAFPGPYGSFNWAFHRDCVALVTRPLALPNERMGVMAATENYNDVAMRISMQYDIAAGGTVVNMDILAGVALLDANLCVVLQG